MADYLSITTAEDDLRSAKARYLRRFGWEETCMTPGSYWLWRRDFADVDAQRLAWWEGCRAIGGTGGGPSKPTPYGVVTADLDLAVSMTRKALDEDDAEDGEG